MIHEVRLSRQAKKDLRKVPAHVQTKLLAWVDAVEEEGLEEVRKVPGYHDEPLKGQRAGQRSIRLSRAYRAIYIVRNEKDDELVIEFALVEEVNKHEY